MKAYLRRGKAYEHLYKLEEALEDVTTTCLLEGFQNQSTLGIADRVLKNLGKEQYCYKSTNSAIRMNRFVCPSLALFLVILTYKNLVNKILV